MCLIILPLTAVSCMEQHSLIGSWSSQIGPASAVLDLKPDGTLSGMGDLNGIQASVTGHYALHNQDMTITLDQTQLNSGVPNPMVLVLMERLRGLTESGHMEWKNDNEFILTNARGIPVPFDRVASK